MSSVTYLAHHTWIQDIRILYESKIQEETSSGEKDHW